MRVHNGHPGDVEQQGARARALHRRKRLRKQVVQAAVIQPPVGNGMGRYVPRTNPAPMSTAAST